MIRRRYIMYAKLIPMVFGALLLTAGSGQAQMPEGETGTAMANAQGGPGRARMMERLRAEGDEITIELLARSEAARVKAQEAMQAGDRDAAQLYRQEAHAYMFTAVKITFPEMADRMGQGMKGCQANESEAGSCGMGQGCGGGMQRQGAMKGDSMGRGMGNGQGQGMMHGKGQGKCRTQEA
jgi:hypothetical protein